MTKEINLDEFKHLVAQESQGNLSNGKGKDETTNQPNHIQSLTNLINDLNALLKALYNLILAPFKIIFGNGSPKDLAHRVAILIRAFMIISITLTLIFTWVLAVADVALE